MAHVVCDPCIKCKHTECVTHCPVSAFREGANMLVIDPDECTGCGVCVDECPVSAIFPEEDVPEKWESYIELNGRLSVIWPEIDQRREPMADAEKYGSIVSKRDLLDESPGEGS